MTNERGNLTKAILRYVRNHLKPFIIYCNKNLRIVWCNCSFYRTANLTCIPEGLSINEFLEEDSFLSFEDLKSESRERNLTFVLGGSVYPCRAVIFKEKDYLLIIAEIGVMEDKSAVDRIIAINKDVINIARELAKKNAALQKANAKIRQLISEDYLTKLASRKYVNDYLVKVASIFKRTGIPVAVIMGDLDYFKKVNDCYGHLTGDMVLVKVAKVIKRMIRKEDLAGRFGGEEFIIILPGADREGGEVFAERLRTKIEEMEIPRLNHKITISLGVTEFTSDDATIDMVLKRADEALYTAKQQGRNKVVVL